MYLQCTQLVLWMRLGLCRDRSTINCTDSALARPRNGQRYVVAARARCLCVNTSTPHARTVVLRPAVSPNDSLRAALPVLHFHLNVLKDSIRVDVHNLYLVQIGGHDLR